MNPNREIFYKKQPYKHPTICTHTNTQYFDKTLNIPSSHINIYIKNNKYIFSAMYISLSLNSCLIFFYLLT